MSKIAKRLDVFVNESWDLNSDERYYSWNRQLLAFLNAALGADEAEAVAALATESSISHWRANRDRQVGHIEGLAISLASDDVEAPNLNAPVQSASPHQMFDSRRVFLVHGHDESAKESTARFLEKIGLTPIILHEQANEGQTIIEKFEAHSDVGYAVVLLTPDDIGASSLTPGSLAGRARQNVVLELGYFTGKLGRRRVCGLFKAELERPSDLHGVLFIELDKAGGWRTKLAQELVHAGMQIELVGLLGA